MRKTTAHSRSFVAVRHGSDPYANALGALEALSLPSFKGRKVLLKPNAGRRVPPGTGITTHPEVVAAACDFFVKRGAEVTVGESTIVGVKPLDCLESTGIAAVVRARGLPLLDLDLRPARKTAVAGSVLSHLLVCGAVADFDTIVSIPVMKTHMHCQVSLSLKNMKGCLRGREKVRLHQLPPPAEGATEKTLDLAVADLALVLRPQIALIDGTVGMEGLGPSAGGQRHANLAVTSTDFLAADAVAAALMGFDPDEIPHLRLSAARGLGSIALDALDIDPPGWRSWIQPFERPPTKLSVEFKKVNVLDKDSCSACLSTLLLFLKRHYEELGDYLPLTIAVGKGHDRIPDNALCIGNCTVRAAVGNGQIVVRGCPPVASDVFQTLRSGGFAPPRRSRSAGRTRSPGGKGAAR